MAPVAVIRFFIDLIEAAQAAWGVSQTDLFAPSMDSMLPVLPDLPDRIRKFLSVKLPNPLAPTARAGKYDRAFTVPLQGFWHCHLAPDVILIYRLVNRTVQLVLVCQHADIEGNRLKILAKRLALV